MDLQEIRGRTVHWLCVVGSHDYAYEPWDSTKDRVFLD
jgi:hypothetical protein